MRKNEFKVCFLLSGAIYGGGESIVVQLTSAFGKENVVCIVFKKGTLYEHLTQMGVKVYHFDESKYNVIQLLTNVRKVLVKENIPVIHSHCVKESIIAGLATIGTKTKNVATVHGADEFCSKKTIKRIYNFIKQHIQYLIFSLRYEAIILVSKNLISDFDRYGNGKKITIIRNGILKQDEATSKGRIILSDRGVNCNRFIVGMVGRICQVKNQEYLINVIEKNSQKFNDIEFVFAGEGKLLNKLEERTRKLDNIFFVGFQHNILPVIDCFDLLVSTSLHEGNPIVLIEALMLKVPVLASDVKGNNEIITDNHNGMLFDLEKPEQFLEKLLKFKDNSELRRTISENGYATYKNEYAINLMKEKYNEVYEKIFMRGMN
jgi:glycosyltransferase involved in cell wall biosynthesis